MKIRLIFTVSLLGLLSVFTVKLTHAQTILSKEAETILSKEDADAMFSLSFQKWKLNTLAAEAAGFVKYDSLHPLEVTMIADVPFGRVITTPAYKDAKTRPWKLIVSVILSPEASAVFLAQSTQRHKAFVQEIYREMRPEYTVMTEMILPRPDGLVMKNYQIFKYGDFPPLDLAGEKSGGCWQDCLKYGNAQ